MYIAVIEPIVLYGASVWAPAADKVMSRNQFDTLQRGFGQKISKGYRTVSLNAAMILSGILPLDLRVREAARLYEIKRGKEMEDLPGRPIEARTSFLLAPHPAAAPTVDFECLENTNPEIIKEKQIRTQIYTDGSKIEGKVGAALTVWKDGAECKTIKLKLEDYCTVYQAEMFALYKAVQLVLDKMEKDVSILSDSRSALETIRDPKACHPLAFGIRETLRKLGEQGKAVRLFWIRAHKGAVGNERADELAKMAALNTKTRAHYDACPISYAKRTLRQDTIARWQTRYENGETAATTKLFLPDVKDAHKVMREIGPNKEIAQLLTGHGGFAGYLHKFKCAESPACVCDPDVEETIPHLVAECPRYALKRLELEITINYSIEISNFAQLLQNKTTRNKFLQFCCDIVRKSNIRNKTSKDTSSRGRTPCPTTAGASR